jgi:hypothetical protein
MLLPQPETSNNQGLLADVKIIRMMDGSRRSFIKKGSGLKMHRYDFVSSRDKMEEVIDFVRRYRGKLYRVTWRDRIIYGRVSATPIEFSGNGRAGGWPGGEAYGFTLEITEDTVRTRDV